MTPDRRSDHETRDRIDLICAEVVSERRRVTVLLSLVAVLLFSLGGITFYLRGQQEQLAHQAQQQAQRASTLASAIQQSRFENVFRGCIQDAARNQATIARYDAALAKRLAEAAKADRSELRTRSVESRVFFVSLINAFLPSHTASACRAEARQQTHVPLPSG